VLPSGFHRECCCLHNTQQISRIIARNGPTLCITESHYTHGKIAVCHFTPLSNFSPLLPSQRQRDRNLSLTLHLFKIVLCVINIHVLYLCALNFTPPYVILVYCCVHTKTLWCKIVLWTETFDEYQTSFKHALFYSVRLY
jgi:hypothetical protein